MFLLVIPKLVDISFQTNEYDNVIFFNFIGKWLPPYGLNALRLRQKSMVVNFF